MVKTASAKKAAQQNAQDDIRMDEIFQVIKSAGEMGITTNRLREHFKGVMGHAGQAAWKTAEQAAINDEYKKQKQLFQDNVMRSSGHP